MTQGKQITGKIILTAVVILASLSCEREIRFRGEETDPSVVVYALLQPDSLVRVFVGESHAVFEERYEPRQITDAVVRVYCDDNLVETLTWVEPGPLPEYYPPYPLSEYSSGELYPVHGCRYRIEVEVPGLPPAKAETEIPDPVQVTAIDTSTMATGYGDFIRTVKLAFRDPAGMENYYRVSAFMLSGYYRGDKKEPYSPFDPVMVEKSEISYGSYSDPIINPNQENDLFGMENRNSYYIFNDQLISGKEYRINLEYSVRIPDTDYYEFENSSFHLHSITRDFYLFLRSYDAHQAVRENFLAEPVLIYTNVTGGLGVVGAMSTSSREIKVGDYPVDGVFYEYTFFY